MAKNPMFGTAQNPNQSTAPTNKLNDTDKKYTRGRNKFDLSRPNHLTARYAEVTPIEALEGVEGDILQFATNHNIRSYTLKSPLQTSIYMKKVYTQVDMKCILPKNWDKVYVNPTIGDDVSDDVNCYCESFFNHFCYATRQINNYVLEQFKDSSAPLDSGLTTLMLHNFLLFEEIFSNGSLLSLLGCHVGSIRMFPVSVTPIEGSRSYTFNNFDEFFLLFYENIRSNLPFTLSGLDSRTIPDISIFRECIDVFKNNLDTTFDVEDTGDSRRILITLCESFKAIIPTLTFDYPLNFGRCAAYQISCATFFSRDSVDNIYTSEKYLEAMTSFYSALHNQSPSILSLPTFDYNGVKCSYDVLSGHTLSSLLGYAAANFGLLEDTTGLSTQGIGYFAFMRNLFGFQKNLRYGDYFVGSKPRPLAVGDVTTEVNDGAVNAIDMTVSLLRARFLNAVNRAGRRFSDYIREVMDGVAPPRDDEPRWLATVRSRVSGFEVENTSNNQGAIVTVLKSSDSNFIYELEVGTPCIIIGVCCFEVQRVYTRTVDRFFMHANRFDMFNKFMQYSGDQGILLGELNSLYLRSLGSGPNFSYTPRHMEYKQRYPIASGGYVNHLPGYIMITDNNNYESLGGSVFPTNLKISSDYLRMRNYEFDQFYTYLSGYGLSDYFHFMIDCDCKCIAYRKMDKNPSIL